MRPISISVKNFASYKEETFDFTELPDLSAAIGSNGAGKSTFFVDSITTVLFNRARCSSSQGTGLENLITTGENSLEVKFIFELDGSEVTVIRRRFLKGGQELELFIDGVNHTDKIKETQSKIDNLIKIDYDTFLDTVIIGQGDSGSFMKKAPNERKEVFTQVMGLNKYDVLQTYTKELRKESKDKIAKLEEKQSELGDSLRFKDQYENTINEGQKEIRRIASEIGVKESELEEELSQKVQYEQKVKERDSILTKKESLESKVQSITSAIEKGTMLKEEHELVVLDKDSVDLEIAELTSKLDDLQAKDSDVKSNKSSLEATNSMLTQQAKELKTKYTKLKDFNEAECGFCGHNITESHKQSHLQTWLLEGKKYLSKINENKEKIENFNIEIVSLQSEINETKSRLTQLKSKQMKIVQSSSQLQSITVRLEELRDQLSEKQLEFEEVSKIKVEELETKEFKDHFLKQDLNTLRNDNTRFQSQIAIAKNELEKLEKNELLAIQVEKEIKELKETYALLDELVTGFGKDGIQAIIIDNALPEIEDEINEFLSLLTYGKVSINFVTQKEKGKGKKVSSIETLDIIINDENSSRTYETYSGGEKFRVDFSCHVGLAKYLAKRSGAAVKFFIVDEGIGSQDEVAKEQFIKAVNKLTTIFEKVLVITHIPDVIESFHNKVEVYKDPIGGSKIRLIN